MRSFHTCARVHTRAHTLAVLVWQAWLGLAERQTQWATHQAGESEV